MSNTKAEPNQLHPELMSIGSLMPWDGAVSSARKYMFSGHIGQALSIACPTERRNQTGAERKYAKYTSNIKMPEDGQIIEILELYPKTIALHNVPHSPLSLVIYENEDGEIKCFELIDYHYNYSNFGFAYKKMSGLSQLVKGNYVKKGTIFMDSLAVTENGGYAFGRECNVALMSHPSVAEDAMVVARSLLPKFGFKTYEKRVVSWGKRKFPVNLYGDENNYKPFPEIGDYVSPTNGTNGLLMALRDYHDDLAIIDQNITAVRHTDVLFDECTYVAGDGGRVVDIRIQHDIYDTSVSSDSVMSSLVGKYENSRRAFYQNLLNLYQRLSKERGKNLLISPELHRWVIEAIATIGSDNINTNSVSERLKLTYRKIPLDEWRVEFTIEYSRIPDIGAKLTDTTGGKGVICTILDDDRMPVTEDGVRADIILDPNAVFSRMIISRLFEMHKNSSSLTVHRNILHILSLTGDEANLEYLISQMDDDVVEHAWQYLLEYYKINSPRMYGWFTNGEYKASKHVHLASVVKDGIYIFSPTDNEPEYMDIVEMCEAYAHPHYGPVKYKDDYGNIVTTQEKVRISSLYMLLLEKTGDDWSSTPSGKLQQHGILSPLSKHDKYHSPARQQPSRAMAESETKNYVSYSDAFVASDLLDRNNNPEVHKEIVKNILDSDRPTDIDEIVSRDKYPLGQSKPLQIMKHTAYCNGYRFSYKDVK